MLTTDSTTRRSTACLNILLCVALCAGCGSADGELDDGFASHDACDFEGECGNAFDDEIP